MGYLMPTNQPNPEAIRQEAIALVRMERRREIEDSRGPNTEAMTGEERWKPPTATRVPILIHPDARDALRALLSEHPRFRESGIGYSEFIVRCVREARKAADATLALAGEAAPDA